MRTRTFLLCMLVAYGIIVALLLVPQALAHRGHLVGTPNPDRSTTTLCPQLLTGHVHGDDILGLGGADELCGREGPDFLAGGRGDDTLYGGKGSDYLSGQGGYDRLLSGRGNDFLQDLYGINVYKCGPGYDVVRTNTESLGNIDADCEEIFDGGGHRLR